MTASARQSATNRYRRKPTEVVALVFEDYAGTVTGSRDFPISLTIRSTGGCTLDAFLGPMPVLSVAWLDPHTGAYKEQRYPHNTVIVARVREYHGVYRGGDEGKWYLDFMDYDEFFGTYAPVEEGEQA